MALGSDLDILSRNARDYVVIESDEFGDMLFGGYWGYRCGKCAVCLLLPLFIYFYLMI